ncbi:MAG: phage portal protein [Asticcacaulis sp.]
MNLISKLTGGSKSRPDYVPHVMADEPGAVKADKFIPLSLTNEQGWFQMTQAGVPVSESSVLALSAAWACVNLLAGTIASLPLVVYRTDSAGNRKVASDHPLYRILHDSPNYDQTAMDFWEGGQASLELKGNLHARKEYSGRRLVALHPIANATARRVGNGSIRYRWTEDGRSYDEPQENVFHVRGFGGGPLGGLSTLSYGRQMFGLSSVINIAAASTFANGLRPSGVVEFQNFLTDEQRDPFERKLSEKFVGAMNAGRPLVLEGGSVWKDISLKPEDAQMLQSRGFSVEEVCRFFGVPPFMVGHNEKSSGYPTSLEQQVLTFQKFALRKRLKRIEQAIMKQLLTPQDRVEGIVVEFNLEGLLRADSAGRSAFYRAMSQIGAMTINEIRALENLPPVAGGDVPRIQSQNVPINMADAPVLVSGDSGEN